MIKRLDIIGRPLEFPRMWDFLEDCKKLQLFYLFLTSYWRTNSFWGQLDFETVMWRLRKPEEGMMPFAGQHSWTVNKSCSLSSVLFAISNYFEESCFCWQQSLWSLRTLKILPVHKQHWITSQVIQFPSCQHLSVSPGLTWRSLVASLWGRAASCPFWKWNNSQAEALAAWTCSGRAVSPTQIPRLSAAPSALLALSNPILQAHWSYLSAVVDHGTELLNLTQNTRPHCCAARFLLKWKTGFLRIQMLSPRG